MILQRLAELYDRLKEDDRYQIPPVGHSVQRIGFRVVLDAAGSFKRLEDIRSGDGGKARPLDLIVPGGDKPPGAVTENSARSKVHLLRNDLPFLLGGKVEDVRSPGGGKTTEIVPSPLEFNAFRDRHLEIEEEVDDPHFTAVCRFLRAWDPERVSEHPEWAEFGSLQGVFQIEGTKGHVQDREKVRSWWRRKGGWWKGESEIDPVQCLVSGSEARPARIHPSIKGIRGGNTTGGGIVGFDKAAFESYGRKQSFNAPVAEEVAFKYVTALNALLNGPPRQRHCITLGNQDAPLTVAFWTDKPTAMEDILAPFLGFGGDALAKDQAQDEGTRERIGAFLDALRVGLEAFGDTDEDLEGTRFFLLGLSPNTARIAVRFFLSSTLSELLGNLRTHHQDIGIVRRQPSRKFSGDPEFPHTQLLLDQTCPRPGGKPDRKKIPPVLAGPLCSAILRGSRYPQGLFSAVMSRVHSDRIVNYPRACIIKGYLNRNLRKEIDMGLDPHRVDSAYRMGRLFAALEKTQKDALGENLNATIRDRFFGAASATPRSVFPRLLRTYQHHLSKLEGGRRVVREKLVQEILDPVEGFPPHLNLTDQGLFALGYYHQNHDFYTPKDQDPADR